MARVFEGVIGIDFGSTYSSVAVEEQGKIVVIANDQGNRCMPSCVAFTDAEELVGEAAYTQWPRNPRNTVWQVKRLLGQKFSDEEVQSNMRLISCPVTASDSDLPLLSVTCEGEPKELTPEEAAAKILGKAKETADAYIGAKVSKAVIAVPTHYTDAQRDATKKAAELAGLEVLRFVNEPAAACVAYGLDSLVIKKTVLVFDMGGAGCECSLIRIQRGLLDTKVDNKDANLGGDDLNRCLINHFATEFNRKYRGMEIKESKRSMGRLSLAVEEVKRVLSTSAQASIQVDGLHEGMDFSSKITRARFEDLAAEQLKKCIALVEKTVADAGLNKADIDEVLMVGGCSAIPKLQSMMTSFFAGTNCEIKFNIAPAEAVAYGAALQGQHLTDSDAATLHPSTGLTVDVTNCSLGIETAGGAMATIIPKGSVVPYKTKVQCSTSEDNQTAVLLSLYEGEKPQAKDNKALGSLALEGIAAGPKGSPQIEVTFDVHADGNLIVHAHDKESKKDVKAVLKKAE